MSVPTAEPASVSRARVSEEEIVEAYRVSLGYTCKFAPPRRHEEAIEASCDAAVQWLTDIAEGTFEPERSKLSTYACTIAVRTLWRRLRKIAIYERLQVALRPEMEPAAPTVAKPSRWNDDRWREETFAALQNAMNGLGRTAQQVISGFYFHRCPLWSLADQLNLKQVTVRQIAFRARVQLARDPKIRSLLLE